MADSDILTDRHGSVLVITLNRPDRLNAWTYQLGDHYFDVLDDAEESPDVRVVVLTGAGRGFCAGMDADVLADASARGVIGQPAKGRSMTHAAEFGKPIVAAINGPCAGFGLVQALHCDVRFAAESAVFSTSFVRRGLNAEYGSSWLLPRVIGQARAAEWLLSARRIGAVEAERMGLVNWVVPDAELMPRVLAYATDLADNCSPVAMAQVKQQIREGWMTDRVDAERRAKELGHGPGGRVDFEEGVRSLVDRRPPRFAPWTRTRRPGDASPQLGNTTAD